MTKLAEHRRARGITQEVAAEELGLRSKGFFSRLESGEKPSIRLALQIEAWSNGEVPAASLLGPDDADLLAHHRRLSTAQPAEVAA